MSMPTMRSCLPNTIIQSWRTSLSQRQTSKPTQPSLRTFFSSNTCLGPHKSSKPASRLFSSLKSSTSSSSRSTTQTPQHPSSIPSAIPSIRTLLTGGRVHQAQHTWSPILHARSFSLSTLLKAARPHWYAGRQVETVRAGPIKKAQWWMDRKIPKSWLFYGIIVTNILVFLGWQYAINSATRFRDFGPYVFMMQNFAASWGNLVRPWTILTSCFSHMDTGHIFVNLFSFYFMGQAAMSILSTSQFASLYLLAGLAGNAVQMLWHPFQGSGNSRQPAFALGASGAISGVLSFYAMAFPHHKLILFFVIPAPAWLAVSGIIAYDMYTAIARPNGGIAAAAHLGGAGAGILYFLKLVGRRPF